MNVRASPPGGIGRDDPGNQTLLIGPFSGRGDGSGSRRIRNSAGGCVETAVADPLHIGKYPTASERSRNRWWKCWWTGVSTFRQRGAISSIDSGRGSDGLSRRLAGPSARRSRVPSVLCHADTARMTALGRQDAPGILVVQDVDALHGWSRLAGEDEGTLSAYFRMGGCEIVQLFEIVFVKGGG